MKIKNTKGMSEKDGTFKRAEIDYLQNFRSSSEILQFF